MAASVTNLAEITQQELDSMAWHPIESLQRHCCINVELIKNAQQQHEQMNQSTVLCNQPSACILCAGFAHIEPTMKDAYLESEKLETMLEGALSEPQCLLQSIDDNTKWQDFYINAMQYLVNDRHTQNKLSQLGARGLPLAEIMAVAVSSGLKHSSILVEIRSIQTLRDRQFMVRVTRDMGNWLYGQWHIATFPDAHQRLTLNLHRERIGDVTKAVLGIAWLVQFAKIPKLQKWVLLSQQMQASLETYAETATRADNDVKIAAFDGSKRSAHVRQQSPLSWYQLFRHSRREQASLIAKETPATASAEVATLSSPKYLPAGTFVISREFVPKFKRRLALLDRCLKIAQTNVSTIRKGLRIKSKGSDASSSEDVEKENSFNRYVEQKFIIQWKLTEPLVARYFNKFEDEAKINWSVRQFTEFVTNKLHEQLPKLKEITTKAVTILRYARPRHAGPMHDYFVPLQTLISSVESALNLADSISMCQMVSLAAHHKDDKGSHIFQLALLEVPDPAENDKMVLHAFIRANPSLVQNMGVSCVGQVLPDKQKTAHIEEDVQVQEQHRTGRKRESTQQQDQAWERDPWSQGNFSWKRRREQWSERRWNDGR